MTSEGQTGEGPRPAAGTDPRQFAANSKSLFADRTEAVISGLMAAGQEARTHHDFGVAVSSYVNAFNAALQYRALEIEAAQKLQQVNYHQPWPTGREEGL